jgi:hypothetical protein
MNIPAHIPPADHALYVSGYRRGRMEGCIRSAIWQLEHGNPALALGSLRRALQQEGCE